MKNFIAAIKADIEGQPWRGDGGRSTIAIIRHNCRFHDRFQGVEAPWKMETREWPVLPGTPWNSLITGLETSRGDSNSADDQGFLTTSCAPLLRADDLLLALSVISCPPRRSRCHLSDIWIRLFPFPFFPFFKNLGIRCVRRDVFRNCSKLVLWIIFLVIF